MSFPLNPAQREAVRYVDGPLLVLAGAGSGKTRVIAAKIGHLLAQGHDPGAITAITFTNKAAREMKERVAGLLKAQGAREAADRIAISTFHALGLRIIRADARALGLKPAFSILAPTDIESLVAELLGSTDAARARAAQWTISRWKNALVSPGAAAQLAQNDDEAAAAQAYLRYDDTLRAYQAVDFDDLIALPIALLEAQPEVAARWRQRCAQLLVDEYQDTNPAQYRLLKILAGEAAAFTAVGDDDQAIYGWRGASLDNLAQLPRDYPALKVIKLEQNYRSTVRILRSANALIANNPKLFEKKLWSEHGAGDPIRVTPAADDEAEAEGVVRRILAHKFEHRGRYADYAVLYRGNHQARLFEQQLRAQNVPYTISGGQSYFERTEIKDLVAYLRLIANDDDDPAFIRAVTTPKRGVGAATLQKLGAIAGARHESLFAAVFAPEAAATLPARQREILDAFCTLINGLRFRAEREPAGRLLDELVAAIGYDDHLVASCEKREAESRSKSVADFVRWLSTKGEADQQEPAGADADDRADHAARGAGGRGPRRRSPVDAARGQGPRVPARLPGRAGGGHPAAPGVDRQRQRRRGAAADVRRRHPCRAQPAPLLLPQAPARGRDRRLPAVALHRRTRAGRPALGRRGAARRRGGAGKGRRQRAAEEPEGDAGALTHRVCRRSRAGKCSAEIRAGRSAFRRAGRPWTARPRALRGTSGSRCR
ncbi:MAG: UvrD-helicase domain-containing protein [Betaproteobacteria bacterium]|nr:UvrD-helicase domain-containing protein [Betaproteobacteria bacterium]